MCSRATRSERSSSRTVCPYPDFTSTVVVPEARYSRANRPTLAESSASDAARVAAIVVRIPPAS